MRALSSRSLPVVAGSQRTEYEMKRTGAARSQSVSMLTAWTIAVFMTVAAASLLVVGGLVGSGSVHAIAALTSGIPLSPAQSGPPWT